MNKLVFVALLILSSFNAFSQEENNNIILGGALNFYHLKDSNPGPTSFISTPQGGSTLQTVSQTISNSFTISPYLGKEIKKSLIVGLQFDYGIRNFTQNSLSFSGQSVSSSFGRNTNQVGVGVFTRHTIRPEKQFALFLQPRLRFNLEQEELLQNQIINREERSVSGEIGAGFGLIFNVNQKFRIIMRSAGIRYLRGQRRIIDTDFNEGFNLFDASFNLSTVFFGFEIKL